VNSALPPPRERRPLRSVPSAGPQFKVDPEVLVKEYVEKEIKVRNSSNSKVLNAAAKFIPDSVLIFLIGL